MALKSPSPRSGEAVFPCYCESVKNLTVTVPDEVYRRARIRAAEEGTSVSSLVTDFLRTLSAEEERFARLEKLQSDVVRAAGPFSAGDRVARDDVHDRAIR